MILEAQSVHAVAHPAHAYAHLQSLMLYLGGTPNCAVSYQSCSNALVSCRQQTPIGPTVAFVLCGPAEMLYMTCLDWAALQKAAE